MSKDDQHVEIARIVIRENCPLTVRDIAEEIGISVGSFHYLWIFCGKEETVFAMSGERVSSTEESADVLVKHHGDDD
ncbi:hypothetical protein C0J52_22301, partial [Blattella germanica]